MAGDGGEEATNIYTPTWVIAVFYTVIVSVSFAVERLLYYGGVVLQRNKKVALYEALQKIKEELMLLGFISLLLTVSEKRIMKICVSPELISHMIPCWRKSEKDRTNNHLLVVAEGPAFDGKSKTGGYCAAKNKVPLISVKAIHDLHIFIFTLAVVHVIYCVLTLSIGRLKIRQWKPWEDSVAKNNNEAKKDHQPRSTNVLMGWLHSFLKQFYGSVNKSDYLTLRDGFIMKIKKIHKEDPKFTFHEYMIEAVEDGFRKVVGISWYLWIFVVIFLLLNVNGWYTYFWIAFVPFILLLAVGTKLEHILIHLVNDVEWQSASSEDHFWFHQPGFVLFLIHFILFQNSFEIAFFFWIGLKAAYSFDACVMGELSYIVVRLIIGVFIQVLCSYSTLPLFALVTQMGDHYNEKIFRELQQLGQDLVDHDPR